MGCFQLGNPFSQLRRQRNKAGTAAPPRKALLATENATLRQQLEQQREQLQTVHELIALSSLLERKAKQSRQLEREAQELQSDVARNYRKHHIETRVQQELLERRDAEVAELQKRLAERDAQVQELHAEARRKSLATDELVRQIRQDNVSLQAKLDHKDAELEELQEATPSTLLLVDALVDKMQLLQLEGIDLGRSLAVEQAGAVAAVETAEPSAASLDLQAGPAARLQQEGWRSALRRSIASLARELDAAAAEQRRADASQQCPCAVASSAT